MKLRVSLFALAIAACGGDDGSTTTDAPRGTDASTNKVVEVGCPASPDATVTTTNLVDAYSPMSTTISANGIVRFVMSSNHNVVPNTITTTDPGLTVGFGATKCLRFTQAGTFGFNCQPHGFVGTVTVN